MYNFFHGPPRQRGIEIEWHVGPNATATGALVAVGAPGPDLGPDLGPGWSAETKGDPDRDRDHRDRVACKSRNADATGASVAVGAPGPDLGPVFNLTPRSRGIEMELHVGPSQMDCFNDYGLSLDTVHDP
ncbi:Hypothetical predicted protein [Olea europaea subsp. europaea]|uniref:Uncharacterized protein n=1 Tax=Olea europaea subsp. europaea TaxID=158383 RepID=A0A8S0RBA8_OLEEU|nr:Hypothetical predicted protein [Olea europaea subsp. europaea]